MMKRCCGALGAVRSMEGGVDGVANFFVDDLPPLRVPIILWGSPCSSPAPRIQSSIILLDLLQFVVMGV